MTALPDSRFLDRTTPPRVITLVLLAALSSLSMNLFLPSLPQMADWFHTEYAVIQLAVPVYFAMNAVLQVFIGPISDRFGRRRVILAALVGFVLATLGCIYAPSVEVFLLFRLLQAVIAAGMVLSRAIVRDMVPADQAASMIGYVTMGMAVVPMAGPMLGGYLDEWFGWQASFWALALLGIALLWLAFKDLGETTRGGGLRFRDQLREYPELFGSRRFWGYALCAAFSAGAFFAFVGGSAYVSVEVYGLSPSMTGLFMGMPSLGYFFGNWSSGRFSARAGINRMLLIGSGVSLFGLGLSALVIASGASHPMAFFGFMVFVGLGNGMTLPNATAGTLSVRPSLAGTAAGIGGAIMIGGGAALSALAGAVLTPGSGLWPLLWIMLASGVGGVLAALYVMDVARRAGPLVDGMEP